MPSSEAGCTHCVGLEEIRYGCLESAELARDEEVLRHGVRREVDIQQVLGHRLKVQPNEAAQHNLSIARGSLEVGVPS